MRQRIKDFIVEKITSGEWPAEHRVSSEHELVHQFGVSRMTVNHALNDLRKEGFVHRIQGLGTYVVPPVSRAPVVAIFDIAQEISARGNRHDSEVITHAARPAIALEAERLSIDVGDLLFHSIVCHFENGQPVQLEDRLVNAVVAPGYIEIDLTRTTAAAYLSGLYPYPDGENTVRAVEATAAQRERLNLHAGEPCLELARTTWIGDQIVTHARLAHPGSRYELHSAFSARSEDMNKSRLPIAGKKPRPAKSN